MDIVSSLKAAWNTTRLFVVKNAPTILTVGGTVTTVAGTIFACKSTLKLNELMAERDAEMQSIQEAHEKGLPGYSEKDYKKDLLRCKTTTVKELAKLYWLPATCTAVGVAGILSGHGMMKTRNVALATALAASERAYNKLKDRTREVIGEDGLRDILYRKTEQTATYEVPDEETGEIVEKEETVTLWDHDNPYSALWDESAFPCSNDPRDNRLFLTTRQNYWNDALKARSPYPVFLNEVREDLGLRKIRIGNLAGWRKGPIDFGLEGDPYNEAFLAGDEETCRLNFNCEGNVLVGLPDSDWGGSGLDRFLED